MKGLVVIGIVSALLLVTFAAAAVPADPGSAAGDNRPTVIIENGRGKDIGLVRVTHIHYAKPDGPGKPPGGTKTATCYKLLGYKWTPPVKYTIQDVDGQPPLKVPLTLATGAWDAWTNAVLYADPDTATMYIPWNEKATDGVNLVTYGNYGTTGIIAVTVTWYNRMTKKAVESDMLFNIEDPGWTWGDAVSDPGVMDVQNIATHETGHTLGLSDLYSTPCTAVTMYGYSWNGDTGKRDLESSDIAGVRKIYGP